MPLYISALFFFTYAANAIAESILIVTRRFRFSLYVNLIYTLVFLCLHNMLLAGQVDTAQLFFYLAMVGAAKLIVSGIYTARVLNASGTTDADNKDIKEVRILWMHIGLYDVLQRVFTWIDKFIVSLVFTAAVSAVYFNATYDIPFLPLLLGAVGGAALMQMAGGSKGNDEIATISLHSARILSAVVFPLFFFLFVYR